METVSEAVGRRARPGAGHHLAIGVSLAALAAVVAVAACSAWPTLRGRVRVGAGGGAGGHGARRRAGRGHRPDGVRGHAEDAADRGADPRARGSRRGWRGGDRRCARDGGRGAGGPRTAATWGSGSMHWTGGNGSCWARWRRGSALSLIQMALSSDLSQAASGFRLTQMYVAAALRRCWSRGRCAAASGWRGRCSWSARWSAATPRCGWRSGRRPARGRTRSARRR